jgi:hypothetical protein
VRPARGRRPSAAPAGRQPVTRRYTGVRTLHGRFDASTLWGSCAAGGARALPHCAPRRRLVRPGPMLRRQDSNLDHRNQNPRCCRYTTAECSHPGTTPGPHRPGTRLARATAGPRSARLLHAGQPRVTAATRPARGPLSRWGARRRCPWPRTAGPAARSVRGPVSWWGARWGAGVPGGVLGCPSPRTAGPAARSRVRTGVVRGSPGVPFFVLWVTGRSPRLGVGAVPLGAVLHRPGLDEPVPPSALPDP